MKKGTCQARLVEISTGIRGRVVMMKKCLVLGLAAMAISFAAGCGTVGKPARLSSEDLEVLTRFAREIEILHSNLPPNSAEKYYAAKTLADHVDFSFTRRVGTLDSIFSSVDARVDNPRSTSQMLNFYYQYDNKSVRFVFYRSYDLVVSSEVIEK